MALVIVGSVIGTVIAIMTIKEIPNTKILNIVNDLRSNFVIENYTDPLIIFLN